MNLEKSQWPDDAKLSVAAKPLTSIERYHLLTDLPGIPNNVFCRLNFQGSLDLDLFAEVAKLIYQRHPLIRCTVDGQGRNWIEHPELDGIVRYESPIPDSVPAIDLETEPGVKVHLGEGPEGTQILFQGHHATADGLACLDMIREAFLVYMNRLSGRDALEGLPGLNYGLLDRRNQLGLLTRGYLKHFYKQPIAVLGAAKFLTRRFEILGSSKTDTETYPNVFPAVYGTNISEDVYRGLANWSKSSGLLKNSLLLGGFFLVLRSFIAEQREMSRGLRLIVPMTLRERKHFRMPGANRSTIVQVDRSQAEMADESTFFYYLDREIRIMRGWRFDLLFPMILRLMSVSNGWLKRSAANPKSRATAVFTNLGDLGAGRENEISWIRPAARNLVRRLCRTAKSSGPCEPALPST